MEKIIGMFGNKLTEDTRIENPIFSISIGDRVCSLVPPDFAFYNQLLVIIAFQTFILLMLGWLVFRIIVLPQKERHGKGITMLSMLFAFGIAIPFVILEPVGLMWFLDIRHVGLRMTLLAMPIVNSLRISEAYFGFTPKACKKNLYNFLVFFSCTFSIRFDPKTEKPIPVSSAYLVQQLKVIGRDFGIMCVVMSILAPYGWELFETGHEVNSFDHSLLDMFSWQHLANNLFATIVLSTSLSQSTTGVSFMFNLVYGYETDAIVLNPMFKSSSPSDFWGRRWNMVVHTGLKNGAYKPMRKLTNSRILSVLTAFFLSGIIHEYVNLVLYYEKGIAFEWKQVLFFGWNGILILLEYCLSSFPLFQWIGKNFPPIIISILVISSALPLAHLFLGDYIKFGYFDAVFMAEPVVICQSNFS